MQQDGTTRTWWALAAGAAVLYAALVADFLNFTVDDVYITLRYARNAAAGLGPVYNPGELVEGYSNFLWMRLLQLGMLLQNLHAGDVDTLPWTAKLLSLGFGVLTLLCTAGVARELTRSMKGRTASVAVLLAAGSAPFAAWSIGGMETMLNAFFFTFAALMALRLARPDAREDARGVYAVFTGLAFGAAALTRPEPVLHAMVGITALWMLLPTDRRLRAVLLAAASFTVLYGAFLLLRVSVYGELLPNTYYAKTGGGVMTWAFGLKYTLAAVAATGGVALLALPAAFLRGMAQRRATWYLLALIASSVFFGIYSGGDWMPGYRFLVPVLPLMAVLSAAGLQVLFEQLDEGSMAGMLRPWMLQAMLLLLVCSSAMLQRDLVRGHIPALESGLKAVTGHALPAKHAAAQWLREHLPQPAAVATGEAGIIGWLNPELRLIDCNGLMDARIARDRRAGRSFDVDYVLDQHPSAVVLLRADIDDYLKAGGASAFHEAILADPGFQARYRLVESFGDMDIWLREGVELRK